MWRDARLVAAKDLRIELRAHVARNQVLPFALCVVVLFGFALGPDQATLRAAAAGLFWVTVLFSTILGVHRSYAIELADGALDGLRASSLDPAGVFFGKLAALAVELVALEVVLVVVVALMFGVSLASGAVLAGAAVLATIGLAALGTLYGVVASATSVRETLLPLLFLPVAAPVLLAAVKAWEAGIAHSPGSATGWIELLAVFAATYLAVGAAVFGPLLEEG